jgi:hypothetical protein
MPLKTAITATIMVGIIWLMPSLARVAAQTELKTMTKRGRMGRKAAKIYVKIGRKIFSDDSQFLS